MLFKNSSIAVKFAIAFSILITMFLAVSATSLFSFNKLKQADRWNSHTYEVLDNSALLISSVVDQETGVRGFLVSGDETFLEPFHEGKKNFSDRLQALLTLTSDNAAQQERLKRIGAGEEKWRTEIAEREIALGKVPATLQAARDIESSGAGKAMMDAIRMAHAEFEQAERSLLTIRSADKDETKSFATTVLIAGSALMLMMSVLIGWLLNRNIGHAVTDMTGAMTALAGGDNGIEVPHVDRRDEIGAMAGAVQIFKENALQNLRLVKEQEAQKSKSEAERQRAQDEAIESERQLVVQSFGKAMSRLADKDLSYRITDQIPAAYEELKENFNNSIANLESAMLQVGHTAESIKGGSGEIRSASDELAKRTEQQAASVEETAAAVDQITVTVNTTAESAKNAGSLVQKTRGEATDSSKVVQSAVEAMGEIKKSSDQIASIIGVIDDIAFQTNLLALNAGVEAARAGDAGKGFAVVAQEVRELAQRSATAAREIKELITTSGAQVENGVALVDKTGAALQSISLSVEEVDKLVAAIAQASQEQASGLREINQAINSIDQGTQQNATMVEEVTASSHTLTAEINSLNSLLATFQTGNAGARHTETRQQPAAVRKHDAAKSGGKSLAAGTYRTQGNAAVKSEAWEDF